MVGKPIVDQCLQGYNGSIFAYGQTGSGKTHTIQGTAEDVGLLPNCFEYLFLQICQIRNTASGKRKSSRKSKVHPDAKSVSFEVKCSYLEIYNEVIIDLLDPTLQKVQIRDH